MGSTFFFVLISIVVSLSFVFSVDRNNFKTCDKSSFCRRCRKVPPNQSPYELIVDTFNAKADSVESVVLNRDNGVQFILQIFALQDNTFRVLMDEKSPLKPRYRVTDSLKGTPATQALTIISKTPEAITLTSGGNKVVINTYPLKLDFYNEDILVTSFNAKGLLRIEHLRTKPIKEQSPETDNENPETKEDTQVPAVVPSIEDEDPGSWEENFKEHHDSKPNGPEAVAVDFSFPQANVLFGIPEHADSFVLKSTAGGDPYRLYNLDVFEYELDNPMALYGSLPVLYGHGSKKTAGVFWQNAAETWVDIFGQNDPNVVSSIVNFVSGNSQKKDILGAHFMSENGIIDVFVMLGPKPNDVFTQYTRLTGTAPIPQEFSLGYHQSRWNYNDEEDVAAINNKFDEYDIPVDSIWLDIEYTDSKKYFTWDTNRFPNPEDMNNNLTAKGRHLVVIVDPHIKRDGNYFLHNELTDLGYYVKRDGRDYEGWCWPGSSSYPDLVNPVVREYLGNKYLLQNFPGTTLNTYLWNDMNEPSVFNGPEVTMVKDAIHYGDWEHRTIHNLYALYHVMSTYEGLMKRSNGKLRPFILTRGFFPGSQRYAAMWTGDNLADWGHLQASLKMCLSISVSGFSFCGADIGGFFGNPDAELFTRWYQAAAFQPFMRAHSHIDTRRREPWLFPNDTISRIRNVVRKRYSYLPFWYSVFAEHFLKGTPVMRPLLALTPDDEDCFKIDYEYVLGDSLLIRPVLEQGVTSVPIYFPKNNIWYDIDTYQEYKTPGIVKVPVDMEKTPVYQRGGKIVPRKLRVRRSSTLMHNDPYTLIICLDANKEAEGSLYIDDGESFDYLSKKYLLLQLKYSQAILESQIINGQYKTESWLEKVIIVGIQKAPTKAILHHSNTKINLQISYDEKVKTVTIRKPGINMSEPWKIELS
uniref:Glucosidase II subunit alpha n=1 Tax=Xenopsylla cheopis TaxID=163159 RepID=A0A6M2E1U1_XENCH